MNKKITKFNLCKFYLSFVSIIYIWCLPLLSKIGFCEPDSTSISQFIANPQATGALGAVSFFPIILINEYQDICINKENTKILNFTLIVFEIMYGLFLTCPVTYAPILLHQFCVGGFSLSFIIHSYYVLHYIQLNKITQVLLCITSSTLLLLAFIDSNHMIYWLLECISFTGILLFTPIDWYLYKKKDNNNYESLL